MNFVTALKPASAVVSKLPLATQMKLITLCCRALQIAKSSFTIRYCGYTLVMPANDIGAAQIYFWYLVKGYWKHELFEQKVVREILAESEPFFFIDAGASYGMYSWISASLPNCRHVYAIEATHDTFRYLEQNIALNSADKMITALNNAIADVSGLPFEIVDLYNSEWNKAKPSGNNSTATSISSITIDDVLDLAGHQQCPVFVKIDIEGGEPAAFVGMKRLLDSQRPAAIMFEVHIGLLEKWPGAAFEFMESVFETVGTRLYVMDCGNERVVEIVSLAALKNLIDSGITATFPHNLHNMLLVSDSIGMSIPYSDTQN